ncbi:MAG TPA: BTAD domain-containing putative transcriptional regulator [Micropepsaceae bacterium]|nr:BTAD domain-containing putative transcriptional regulator [Micropepsaceae bacterium]
MNSASGLGNGIEVRSRWSLRLFGGFELGALPGGERVALPGKRERVLLAYLALSPNCRHPRRKLAALLWGDASEEAALDNLRTCIWGLRKALGDAGHRVIGSEGDDLVLDAAALEVDTLAFRRLAAQSGRTELEAAANLYAGEFLDGLDIESEEFESWRRAEAARYRDQSIDVLTRLMTQLAACGDIERAIDAGARILSLEPLHEAAVRRLMRLYGESGRRGAAVQIYRDFVDVLRTELNTEPEAETRLVFAEIARGGEERTSGPAVPDTKLPSHSTNMAHPSDASGGPAQPPPRRVFRVRAPLAILAGVAIVAVALIAYWQFAGSEPNSFKAAVAERTAFAPQASPVSIVVLPFANLSGDASQEFFSDGMTEEITSALAKVPSLRVLARTSAFQFKGQNLDVRMIARSLGASHLIEGSVRKIGNRVRISAQLIEAANGTNLWTESYEREFTDIFAAQEEIAQAIAAALRMPLGLAPGERLVANSAIDPQSYEQYLRAMAIWRTRNQTGLGENRFAGAIAMLEHAIARDPAYAPAWALLARISDDPDKRRMAAQEALRLDPRNATYSAVVGIQAAQGNWAVIEDLRKQALTLDPTDPDALDSLSNSLAFAGRLKEALSIREKLRILEPFVPVYNYITASIMLIDGQSKAAIPILEALPAAQARNTVLAHAYATEGRYREAADTILAIKGGNWDRGAVEEAARLIRSVPTKVKAAETLPALDQELSFVYLYIGAPDRVLDYQERQVARYPNLGSAQVRYLWSPDFAPVRKTERFKTFVRKMGFVDYWRARGWPDLCHPVGADDFVCA